MKNIEIKKDILTTKLNKELTFVHISDIHFNINTKERKLHNITETIINIKPNYIFITGDIIDNNKIIKNKNKIKELVAFLSNLSKIAPVIISLGNHDITYDEDITFFNKLNELNNIYILNNSIYEDENIYASGHVLQTNYYYNVTGYESKEVLLKHLDNNKNIIHNLPKNKYKITLIHSPILLNDEDVINKLKEYDLVLSGHMHNGMIPRITDRLIRNNYGLISPGKHLFPNNARGKIINNSYTIIISGGITKLSLHSSRLLSKLNFIYPISINEIKIKGEKNNE